MSGRLTLTWANKEKALLSYGETGYEWVDRDDPRAREVRLLDEVGRVGEVTGDASDNLLFRGDSLDALRALVHSAEYAAEYRGKVKLVYIDPPFNTGQAFEHYDDSLEHSVWLGMMRERLVLIRELLAPDGSVWVHLDDAEMAYCRVLMDEVFGRSSFAGHVVWRSTDNSNNDAKSFSSDHNSILVFSRHENWLANPIDRTEANSTHYANPDNDPRGPWFDGNPLGSPSPRENLRYVVTSPQGLDIQPPPNGWRWSKETLEVRIESGEIRFNQAGTALRRRTYLNEQKGLPPSSLWASIEETGSNRLAKNELKRLFPGQSTAELFSTPKPERLLERIIHIGSNPGDIVVDCFAGSGTTAAVAHKMGRRWVTAELSANTADTFTRPRLEKVVNGDDSGGITESAGWVGGSGFRELRVAASSWQVISDEHGTVALQADDVDHATLGRAVAAQLGYLPIDSPIWFGAKGRSRLAVVEGVIDAVAVADVVSALGEGETALIAALAATHDAETTLRELSRGSRILRLPVDLFPKLGLVTR